MCESKMREEFEKAVALEAGEPLLAVYLSRRNDTYSTSTLHFAWWAWKASREAVVIELPPVQMAQRSDEEATFSAGGNDMRRKVIKAIEACGVKATA